MGSLLNPIWPDGQNIRQLLSRLFQIYGTSVQPTRFAGPGLFPSDGNRSASEEKTL